MKAWRTFDNRIVTMADMEHQHMSNIYFFINYIVPELYGDNTRIELMEWLNLRFVGMILPYQPHPDFKSEIDYLKSKGYLRSDNHIVVNNRIIGKLASKKL